MGYAVGCRRALHVPVGGGEVPLRISRVLGDFRVSPTASFLCEGGGAVQSFGIFRFAMSGTWFSGRVERREAIISSVV